MNFFDNFPAPELVERPRTVEFVPPPWLGPPKDELPTTVHIGQFLHRSPTRVLIAKSAEVFTTGCSINFAWVLRRGDESYEEWNMLHASAFQHGPGMGPTSRDGQLMFGVELPDGRGARTGLVGGAGPGDINHQPEAPFITFRSNGGSGGENEVSASGGLWLWPLPPEGDLRLLAQWKGLGLEECSIVLDGSQLLSAAEGVQKLWQVPG